MKKIVSLIMTICLASTSLLQAQTEKGHFLIGTSSRTSLGFLGLSGTDPSIMSLGFNTVKYKDDSGDEYDPEKFTSINVSPRFGYFLAKNFALGLDLNLAFMKYSVTGEYDYTMKSNFFTIGPFFRYYIPTGKIYTFLEAGAAWGSQKSTTSSSGNSEEITKAGAQCYGGGAGIAVPLGKKVTFDTMLTYNTLSSKDKEDNDNNARNILGTFGIKFGFHIFLGK